MTLLEELANADIPGAKIRLALMKCGAKAEQERIIKLLETEPTANPKDYSDEDIWAFEKAIALIKGENK